MLFFNFLCLLYLMVLVNGHTISKSIANEDDADDIFDSLTDVDHTRGFRLRHDHDRFLHKHRRGNTEATTTPLPHTKTTTPTIKKPKNSPETTETVKITETTTHAPATTTATQPSTKQGLLAFWKKFKTKKKQDAAAVNKQLVKKNKELSLPPKGDISLYTAIRDAQRLNKRRRKNYKQFYLETTTRVPLIDPIEHSNDTRKEKRHNDDYAIKPYKHYIKSTRYYKPGKFMSPEPVNFQEVTSRLNTMTTKLTHLKQLYGVDRYKPKDNVLTRDFTSFEEAEYPGTEQIELLLNDIKKKAVQIMAEQNPIVTDIITNTATEATFEADPILSHLTVTNPSYALTTFVTMNDVDNFLDKRTADTFVSTDKYNDSVLISYVTPRNLRARSIGSEAMTIAQSVEDLLQKELKCAYKKLRHKVSTDLKKEMTTMKSTLKKHTKKVMSKVSPKHIYTLKTTTSTLPRIYKAKTYSTPLPRSTRKEPKNMKMTKKAKTTKNKPKFSTPATSTSDDYALLALYEQMLTKSHQNIILMPSNPGFPSRRKRRENLRNPETLTDLRLKENIKKIYDDGEEMPEEIEYEEEPVVDSTSSNELPAEEKVEEKSTTEEKNDETMTDNSFEGLSNKISYNDYVNGYKHYLKFQKEQGEQHWSNQIKYQAHKHHSVDDIGKFILNKLPHVPVTKRYRRHFFEDTDTIDDQDISTKSDDSWFKKHFYMFIETAPPKKFHNTQTVSLKSPGTENEPGAKSSNRERIIKKGITEILDSEDVDLDELSRALGENAATTATPTPAADLTIDRNIKLRNVKEVQNSLSVKELLRPRFFEKIFSSNTKSNTTTKKPTKTTKVLKEYKMNDDFLVDRDLNRLKRDELKDIRDYISTVATSSLRNGNSKKNAYVNIDLIPRSTAAFKGKQKKRGKFRRFFSKFRVRKKHKQTTTKRVKRQLTPRIERFNPFKKLKTMFKGNNDKKLIPANNMQDYDMLTSSIVSFKPIKYDKFQNVDDMKNQVPNITYDFANDLPPQMEKEALKTSTRSNTVNIESSDSGDYFSAESSTDFNFTTITSTTTTPELRTTSKNYQKPQFVSHKMDRLPEQNYKPMKPVPSREDVYTTTPPMTLEQIRSEVDDLRLSLSNLDYIGTTPINVLKTKSRRIAVKAKRPQPTDKFNSMSTNNFTFPTTESVSLYADFNDIATNKPHTKFRYLTPHKREKPIGAKQVPITKQIKSDKGKSVHHPSPEKSNVIIEMAVYNKTKSVPDYFNDLLMWHRDILEREKVGNPTWEEILKSLRAESELTTPDVVALQKEIAMMKSYLQETYANKTKEQKKNNKLYTRMQVIAHQMMKTNATTKQAGEKTKTTVTPTAHKDNFNYQYGTLDKYSDRILQATDFPKFTARMGNIMHGNSNKQNFMKTGYIWSDDSDEINVISSSNGPSAIFVDTTVLSYDDAVHYVTAGLEAKKLSKNSLTSKSSKSSNSPQAHHEKKPQYKPQPIAKTNKQPLQYFTTPLPMRMNDFERFLKANNLDVESVTSPLIDLPSFVDLWGGKLGHREIGVNTAGLKADGLTKVGKDKKEGLTENNQFTKIAITKSNPSLPVMVKTNPPDRVTSLETENQMEYLEKLRLELANDFEDDLKDKRFKRYDNTFYGDHKVMTNEPSKRETIDKNTYYDKFKKRFFDKKVTFRPTSEKIELHDVLIPSSDKLHKEMEITIINLDDINKKFESDKGLNSDIRYHTTIKDEEAKSSSTKTTFVIPTKAPTSSTNNVAITTKSTKPTPETLPYEKMFKDLNKMINTTEKPAHSKDTNSFKNFFNSAQDYDLSSLETTSSPSPDIKPKRIQISSHCYKYDIFYNEVPHAKTKNDKNYMSLPTRFTKDVRKSPKHSENEEVTFGFKTGIGWNGNARLAREANPTIGDSKPNLKVINLSKADMADQQSAEAKDYKNLLKKLKFFTKMHKRFKLLVSESNTNITKSHATKATRKTHSTSPINSLNLHDFGFPDDVAEHLTTKIAEDIANAATEIKEEFTPPEMPSTTPVKEEPTTTLPTKRPTDKNKSQNEPIRDKTVATSELDKLKAPITENPMTTIATKKHTTTNIIATEKTTTACKADTKVTESKQMIRPHCKAKTTEDEKSTTKEHSTTKKVKSTLDALTASQLEAHGIHMVPKTMTEGETFYIEPGAYDEVKAQRTQEEVSVPPLLTATELEAKGINLVPKPIKTETFYVEPGAYDEGDKVYYETEVITKSSSVNSKPTTASKKVLSDNKIDKRDIQTPAMCTAKDVAALETNKKRSLEPLRVRKVFSAKMSSPVDLEYQVHSYDNVETTRSNEMLSPGLYLLINDGTSLPKGHFALKPLQSTVSLSNIMYREAGVTPQKYEVIETTSVGKVDNMTLSKEFVSAINKHLVQLYENFTAINETQEQNKDHRNKRFIKSSLESIKRYFGHDRVCACKCKPNRTMCRACAASDSVVSELIFEFDNLANYMKEHCTEIQTYFWMNPTGGKQLTDAVHKIDNNLRDYYKNIKNKCQGRTCNSFATAIDKRAFNGDKDVKDYIGLPMVKDLMYVASILRLAKKNNCYNETLKEKSNELVDSFNTCIAMKNLDKRSTYMDKMNGKLYKNVYSLDNVNVNIICRSESSPDTIYSETTKKNKSDKRIFDYLLEGLKRKKKGKRYRKVFTKNDIKDNKWLTYYSFDDSFSSTEKTHIKRQADIYQIESPLVADTGGSFWLKYIKGKRQSTVKGDTKTSTHNSKSTSNLGANNFTAAVKHLTKKNEQVSKDLPTEKQSEISTDASSPSSVTAGRGSSKGENNNGLLKLFGNLAELDEIQVKYDSTTTTTELSRTKTKEKKPSKPKKIMKSHKHQKKTSSTRKKPKTKPKPTKNATDVPVFNFTLASITTKTLLTKSQSTESRPTESQSTKSLLTESPLTSHTSTERTKQTTIDLTKSTENISERPNIFDKIKMGTISLISKFQINYEDATTTSSTETRRVRTPDMMTIKAIDVESNITTSTNPTILIINEYGNAEVKNPSHEANNLNYSELLLSIIQHETNKLNDEWEKVASKHVQQRQTTCAYRTDLSNLSNGLYELSIAQPKSEDYVFKDAFISFVNKNSTTKPQKLTPKSTYSTSKPTIPKKDSAAGDYDILQIIQNLEIPEPAETHKSKGLFNKIANKLGVKVIRQKKQRKAATRIASKMTTLKCEAVTTLRTKPGASAQQSATDKETSVIPTTAQIKNNKVTTSLTTRLEGFKNEACETRPVSKLCDLRATFNHILALYHKLRLKDFENYVRNITCYKYKRAPKYFFIKSMERDVKVTQQPKWNWIRDKRSIYNDYDDADSENVIVEEIDDVGDDSVPFNDDGKVGDDTSYRNNIKELNNKLIGAKEKFKNRDENFKEVVISMKTINFVEYDGFETFNRDNNGIYKMRKKRNKRTADSQQDFGLKNLPRLRPALDEIYVMLGDSVSMSCLADNQKRPMYRSSDLTGYNWRADGNDLLGQDNVVTEGPRISIKKIEPRNVGRYYCNKDNKVKKNMRVSVVTLPSFRVISTPLYTSNKGCTYDDLNSLQSLGAEMSKVACCDGHCSVKVEEPLCLKDREDGRPQMKAAVVSTVEPHCQLACSVQCRRDMHSSVTLLHARNVQSLSNVAVVVRSRSENKTLTPSKVIRVPIVTHTLRRKDASRNMNYHKLTSNMAPGDVTVLALCPAGYYLIPDQKICATCPKDTHSSAGDNACAVCPRGSRAGAGASACSFAPSRLPRYDWWWYPPCGYCVACVVVVCGCGACAVLALAVHLATRSGAHEGMGPKHPPVVTAPVHTRRGPARPLSPSRVILARFFRPSLSSARATDSQETKFEQWKERHVPPPLPPIDFDL